MTGSPSRLATLAVLGLAATLGAWAVGPPPRAGREDAPAREEAVPDPVPMRRVMLPADRLAGELKRVNEGTLTRMPRAEFDQLVRRAGASVAGGRLAPRLVEASYRARLTDAGALVGTARWKVHHEGAGEALVRLRPESGGLSLALQGPRVGGQAAVLADFPGEGEGAAVPALLVSGRGEHTVTAGWSARGEARPEGLRVDLRLPECPVGELELDLPDDASPVAPPGALVSAVGPGAGGRRSWRVACGGASHLPLLVRRGGPGPAVVMARHRSVQRLGPDGLEVTATFEVEALHRDVDELVVELGAGLRPVAVTTPLGDRWEQRPGAGGAVEVVVRLARPAREATLEVRALAPLRPGGGAGAGPAAWVSPAVRVAGAIPRGETLELWLHPELRVSSFSAGDFRLGESGPGVDERQVRWQRLVLQGGGLAEAGAAPRRPSASVQVGGVELHVKQQAWWQVAFDGMALTTRFEYEVRQGLLFDLPLRLPAGWVVEGVDLAPEGALRSWGVRVEKGGSLLLVDLRQPLRPGSPGTLTVRLRSAPGQVVEGRELAFPDLQPVGARFREGGLAIDYDERVYRGAPRGAPPGAAPPAEGPWGQSLPDHYFPFQGSYPGGSFGLIPRVPKYRGRAQQDVFVRGSQALLQARVSVEAESGTPSHVDVWLSAGGEGEWGWRAEGRPGGALCRVARAERLRGVEAAGALAGLAGRNAAELAALAGGRPGGALWRLHFDRPLPVRQPVAFVATRELTAAGPGPLSRWVVPLVGLPGATRLAGEVAVHLIGAEPAAVEQAGLREVAARGRGRGVIEREYRYGQTGARFVLQTRPLDSAQSSEATADRARLTSRLTGAGRMVHHFRFRARRWAQRALPVQLPAGAELLAAAVDGHWLQGLAVADDGSLALPVPVVASGGDPTFQIVYATGVARPRVSARLEAPVPALPIQTEGLERRWLLPPELVPLTGSSARRVPGTGVERLWQAPSRALDLFRAGPSLLLPGRPVDRRPDRLQALTDAVASLCNDRPGARMSLGTLVEEVVSGYLRDAHPLVIDVGALAQGGVTAAAEVELPARGSGEGPWGGLGLGVAAVGPAVLLTTGSQLARWPDGEPPVAVDEAAGQAVALGSDPSGRFLLAVEWLARGVADRGPNLLGGDEEPGTWAEWVAAPEGEGAVVVVRRELGTVVGLGVATLLLLALVLGREWVTRRWSRVLLLWVGVAGVSLPWLPEALKEVALWPLLAGLATSGVVFLRWTNQPLRPGPAPASVRLPPAPRPGSGVVTGAGLLVLLGLAGLGAAQVADPETVFLVAEGGPGGSALLTPRLARTLRSLTRPALAPRPGAVLVSAAYEGAVFGGRAEVEATFEAHCTGDGPHTLVVPLDGVQLVGDVTLDGARAFPVALPAAQGGYALTVRGRGAHKVVMRMQAAVSATPDDPAGPAGAGKRQVKFQAPRLSQSRLKFRAPRGAKHLQAPVRLGQEVVRAGKEGPELEADLGAVAGPVELRWYQEVGPAKPARVEYREAHLWDLRPDASVLTTVVRYEVSAGVVTDLTVGLPAELELRTVQARRPVGSGEGPVRMSGWGVQGAGAARVARLTFPGPVSGPVEVVLGLVPRGPWSGEVVLPLPRPGGEATGAGHLAYRARGVAAVQKSSLALTGIPAAKFAPYWPEASRPAAGSLAFPSSFRRDAARSPELRLVVRPAAPRLQASQEVTLRVGARQAELFARLALTAQDKDLSVFEWEVASPLPVLVGGVSGADVHRWSQAGNRLLVWLKQTTGSTRVDLTAWVPLAGEPAGGKKAETRLDLPALRPVGVAAPVTRMTLIPAGGLQLTRPALRQLVPAGGEAGGLTFESRQATYGGSFLVGPGPVAKAAVRTRAAVEGREVVFESAVDYAAPGDLRALTVRLSDWGGDARLEAPAGAVVRRREQTRRTAGRLERSWALDLAPGVKDRVRVTVRGRAPLEELAEGMRMPDVLVPGAEVDRQLSVGEGLLAEPGEGLVPAASGVGAQTWRVTGEEWSLRAVPAAPRAGAAVEALLTEVRASRFDGRRWVYQMDLTLWHGGPSEVSVRWPGEVEVLGATVDGAALAALQVGHGRLWLPLTGRPGVRRVGVRYRLPGGGSQPDLAVPQLEDATRGPVVWTVQLPTGWEVVGSSGPRSLGVGATRRAAVELYRGSAGLEVRRRALGWEAGPGPADRVEGTLSLAGLALRSGADGARAVGPGGVGLSRWAGQLQKELEQVGPRPDGATLPAEEEAGAGGIRVSWVGGPADRLSVRLVPTGEREARQALAATGEWLLVWLAIAGLAVSSLLRSLARWLWPELALGLGLLGWQLAGPTVPVVFLLVLSVTGRALLVVQWAQGRWQRAFGDRRDGVTR